MKKISLTLASPFIITSLFSQTYCGSARYDSEIFPNVTVTSDVIYGSNVDLNNSTVILKMDVYQPTGDTASKRPLIVFAHGGSFIGGDKTNADQVALCTRFAKRGYITATINYRLGMGFPINQTNAQKAVWRAVQDMKAAVRFFRKDAATTNTYKADPNFVFVGGYSAGAFMAVHYAYLDQPSEIPAGIDTTQLGGFEGNSGNPGYCTAINGVINLAGAVGDTSWIQPGDEPMVSAHGNNDGTVPYCTATIYVSGFPIMPVSGSGTMNIRCFNVGICNPIHTYYGQDHCASVGSSGCPAANMDTTVVLVSNFVYKQLGCIPTTPAYVNGQTCVPGAGGQTCISTAGLKTCLGPSAVNYIVPNNENIYLYPNPASENLILTMTNVKGNKFSGEVYDLTGRTVSRFNFSAKEYLIKRNQLQAGIYFLKITSDENEMMVKKIVFTK